MPSRPLGPHTIRLLPPTEVIDAVDNTTYLTYSTGPLITGCFFQPFLMTEKFQEEFTNERDATRTFFRVFMPWTDVTELVNDKYKIEFNGVQYEVHALLGKWNHFSGERNHVAFLCKRRTG